MRKLIILMLTVMLLAACGGTTTTSTGGSSSSGGATTSAASGGATKTASGGATAMSGMTMAAGATMAPATTSSGSAGAGATTTGAGGATGAKKLRVGLVTDTGKVNDGTFNQFAYEGMKRAEKDLAIETNYVETAQQSDYETNLNNFAGQKYDLIIGVGFLMGDAIKAAATKNPSQKFAIVDVAADPSTPNVKGLTFQEDQAGYLAGVAAALVSKTGKIGVVGGKEIPPVQKYVMGYEAGAKSIKADIKVAKVYIDSFTDAPKGAESAKSMMSDGADVIFGAGGQTGSGGIAAAAAQGGYVIGVDQDEWNTTFKGGTAAGSDHLITSALKRVDNAVYTAIKEAQGGAFQGGNYTGTVANGGVDYADPHKATNVMTADVKAKLDQVKKGLADGSIKTGVEIK